jgi:predicted PurR-regulated permease PerM
VGDRKRDYKCYNKLIVTRKKSHLAVFIEGVRTRIADIRLKVAEIKNRKEKELAETMIPGREKKERMVVELNSSSVAKSAAVVLLMILLFYFFYEIRWVLLIVFISFLLAAALDPIVDWMQKYRFPRPLSVLIIYFVLLVLAGIFVTKTVTMIAGQVGEIAQNVGDFLTNLTKGGNFPFAKQIQPYLDQFYRTLDLQTAAAQIQNALQIVASQLLSISIGLLNLLIVLILTFFMTVEEQAIEDFVNSLVPAKYTKYISTRLDAIKDQIGYWLRGQFLVCVIAAVLTYIVLALLGINYALTLSVVAGLCMIIPVIGRVFAWVIAFPIVFNQDPWLALWMSVAYFVIQQIENNYIVTVVMSRAVGLSPIIIMIAMLIGAQYLGILGLILAIPLATIAAIFVKDYVSRAK